MIKASKKADHVHLKMSALRIPHIFRPLPASHIFSRPPTFTIRHRRCYAFQSYGGGGGDPKGENPQEQGPNPSADIEHPGPPPPDEGKGTGGGASQKGEGDHNTQESPSNGHNSKPGASQSSGGPQPKIYSDSPPAEPSDEVKAHNEEMKQRHDRPNEQVESKSDTVGKGFWKVRLL